MEKQKQKHKKSWELNKTKQKNIIEMPHVNCLEIIRYFAHSYI